MNIRIFVEKKNNFQVATKQLQDDLNMQLGLKIKKLRLLNIYDIFNINKSLLDIAIDKVFSEVVTDDVYYDIDLSLPHFAVEYLPGQFDQRAQSAMECLALLDPTTTSVVRSAKLLIFNEEITDDDLGKIKKYYINEIESREKDLSILSQKQNYQVDDVPIIEGFITYSVEQLQTLHQKMALAMSLDDLIFIQEYFIKCRRNPNETEIRVLDTYWSDHCRHTTFETILADIKIEDSFLKEKLTYSLNKYYSLHEQIRPDKPSTMMDMATIVAKKLYKEGYLDDLEKSEENNACSIVCDVDVDGVYEQWLLMFKNETHNHPTEIEPFGGAATCIGGAIRDPLSGRSYVYQASRITGAANIYSSYQETLPGKLPQAKISKLSAAGYSSYGNQIGLATTFVREVYHPGFVAKRLEIGAVVGAVKKENVRRSTPLAGDIIILCGGATGRDGIGGATGSSKEHTEMSLEKCASEVQKGNAIEERKLQRLFLNPEVTKMIKKANDFGAGGVSVAIGELAPGLEIFLDRVPTKYLGLNATELAISESQERMAVVIARYDLERFIAYCHEENLNATHVANVTASNRLQMFYKDKLVVDLERDFIDTNGVQQKTNVIINHVAKIDPFLYPGTDVYQFLARDNIQIQKGLGEMFDATIGTTTVLMPYGGKYQMTPAQASVQKLPTDGYTKTASILAYGYDSEIASWSPYHGSVIAILDSMARVVACGGNHQKIRFTFQEYFERMQSDPKRFGKPVASLLGAIYMQDAFSLPAIGGKDSMSGTYKNYNVPPTLVSFAVATTNVDNIISPEFKSGNHYLYLIDQKYNDLYLPDVSNTKENFTVIEIMIENNIIDSSYALGYGGILEALAKMSFGNRIGATITTDEDIFKKRYGSFIVATKLEVKNPIFKMIGKTTENDYLSINGTIYPLHKLEDASTEKFSTIYPMYGKVQDLNLNTDTKATKQEKQMISYPYQRVEEVKVLIPVFPGTNCDIDTKRAFTKEGAKVTTFVFNNLSPEDILNSITQFAQLIDSHHILALAGGFSAGDEPDGSGKFIANVLRSEEVQMAIKNLLARKGLILGICNGFQALIKSGFLPFGDPSCLDQNSPTLFVNDINRHISQIASTVCCTNQSPWLSSFAVGEVHKVPISHGEGKLVISKQLFEQLSKNNQIAFQYCDTSGNVATNSVFNPNGSNYAIEGIISPCGLILGKMAHSERKGQDLYKNIPDLNDQNIFKNAISYFKKEQII